MKKTDGRFYNRKSNRDLAIEMDLWCKWVDVKKPILIGTAIAPDRKGCFELKYQLFYNPDLKLGPYMITNNEPNGFCVTTDSISKAKKLLKNWDFSAKWIKNESAITAKS